VARRSVCISFSTFSCQALGNVVCCGLIFCPHLFTVCPICFPLADVKFVLGFFLYLFCLHVQFPLIIFNIVYHQFSF
jgi:hypothetical protein